MTVLNSTIRADYAGAGTVGPFATAFYFIDPADIFVVITDNATGVITPQTLNVDYTVDGALDAGGGSVTFTTAVPAGKTISIQLNPPLLQPVVYPENGSFPAKSHEHALDHLTQAELVTRATTNRALLGSPADINPPGNLPPLAQRLGKYLAFDPITGAPEAIAGTLIGIPSDISSYQATATGGATHTLADWFALPAQSLYANVKTFLAVGDGVADDTAHIQNAINTLKATVETPTMDATHYLFFPSGTYRITSPLILYAGVVLIGEGAASVIYAAAGFVGAQAISLVGQVSNSNCWGAGVRRMGVKAIAGVTGIKASAGAILNCIFDELYFDCQFCLNLGTYIQLSVIRKIYSFGTVDQILHLIGNANYISDIDKEGNTGASVDPYIYIEGGAAPAQGNHIYDIIIEGATSVNKSLIKLRNCILTTLDRLWFEPTLTNNKGLEITGCTQTHIGMFTLGLTNTWMLSIDTSTCTVVDTMDCDGGDFKFTDVVSIDATSDLLVHFLRMRRGQDLYKLSFNPRITIERTMVRQIDSDAAVGYARIMRSSLRSASNLYVNPSFESGNYGWVYSSAPTVEDYTSGSAVAPGRMAHLSFAAPTLFQLWQNIPITAAMVAAGVSVTVTGLVNVVTGTFATPFSNGAGIVHTNNYQRANPGQGWQLLTRTVQPTAAGTLEMGFEFTGVTEIMMDELCVTFGPVADTNGSRFGSLEVNGNTWTFGNAIPSNGTWKVGDRISNSAPVVGSPKGWLCTVAGSPGTWVSEGNL